MFLKELQSLGLNICFGYFPSEVFPKKIVEYPSVVGILKKYIKNRKITLGAQSGSQRMLKKINRAHTLQDVAEAVKILRVYGFKPVIDIIFGLPGETSQDRRKTLEFMRRLAKDYQARFNIHHFIPLPQTPFFKCKPEILEEEVKEEIANLMRKGVAFGNFFLQLASSFSK